MLFSSIASHEIEVLKCCSDICSVLHDFFRVLGGLLKVEQNVLLVEGFCVWHAGLY